MKSLRYLTICCLSLLAGASMLLSACGGADCGEGTVEQDGECVLEEEIECADGTHLVDGECVPEEEIECADGTSFVDGECVADVTEDDVDCPDGELYDAGVGDCVTELSCGVNTEQDGNQCIADDPTECGDDTELAADTNECIPTEEVCDGGTAFSEDQDRCVPTDEVCQDGTYFDDDSRLCYPEAECQAGDVVLEGECVSAAEALAAEADVFGETGEPVDFSLGAPGEQTIFTGTIDGPSDLDGNGEDDQHVDIYTFDASQGDWLDITVQSMGGFEPIFLIASFDQVGDVNFLRFGPMGTGTESSRQVALPESGEHMMIVQPAQSVFEGAPALGDDDWDYVGTIEQMERPEADSHEYEAEHLAGSLGPLDENFFYTDEFDAGTSVQIRWEEAPEMADEELLMTGDPEGDLDEIEFVDDDDFVVDSVYVDVPDTGELYFIYDWSFTQTVDDLDYQFSVVEGQPLEDGDDYETDFTADEDDGVRLQVDVNAPEAEQEPMLDVSITDATTGAPLAEELLLSGDEIFEAHLSAGDYTVTVENNSGEDIDFFNYELGVAEAEPIETEDYGTRDLVEVAEWNNADNLPYVSARHDDSGEVLMAERMVDIELDVDFYVALASFYTRESGDHTLYHFDFEDLTTDFETFYSEPTDVHSTNPEQEEENWVLEAGHSYDEGDTDDDNDIFMTIADSDDEVLAEGLVGPEDRGLKAVNVADESYTISYYDFGADDFPDVGEEDFDYEYTEPEEVDILEEVLSGTASEDVMGEHGFYSFELEDTTEIELTFEVTEADFIGGEFTIYSPGHGVWTESPDIVGGFFGMDDEVTMTVEFAGGVEYVVQVGGGFAAFGPDDTFDYEMSFEEVE